MFSNRRVDFLDSGESSPTRSGSLTIYAPGHDSTSEEDDSDSGIMELNIPQKTPVRNRPSDAQMDQIRPSMGKSELTSRDIELLYLVCRAADKVNHDKKESLNYAGLYGTLQVFYDTNGLTSKSFPSYDLCIYTTMLLCSYDLPTWSERLDAFINENKSRVQLRRVYHEMGSAVNERILSKFLLFWLARTAYLRKTSAAMETVAINRDTRALTRESLQCWMYRTDRHRTGKRRANAIYSRNLALLLIRTLKRKKDKCIELKEREKTFPLRKPFFKWLDTFDTYGRNAEKAEKMNRENVQRKYLLSWLYAAFEQKTSKSYDGYLVRKSVFCWMNKIDTFQRQRDAARRMQFAFHVGKVFEKWLCTLDDHRADSKLADTLLWRNILTKYKDRWIFETDMKIKFNIVHQSSNRRLLINVFSSWQQNTEEKLESDRFRKFMLLKNTFRHWRLETGRRTLQIDINRTIVSDKFHNWLLKERLILFTRYSDSKIVEQHFRVWLRLAAKKYKRNVKNRTRALTAYHKNLVRDILHTWMTRTYQHAKNDVKSAELRIFFLTSKPFFKMRDKTRTYIDNEIIAMETYRDCTLKRVFEEWQHRTVKRVSYRMSIAKRRFETSHSRQIKKDFFTLWRNSFLIIEQNNQIADLSLEYAEVSIKSKIMGIWRDRYENNSKIMENARLFYNDTTLRMNLEKWIEKKNSLIQLEQEAAFLAEVRDLKVQESLYRHWRMHAFRIASQERNADELLLRIRSTRFRKIWKVWLIRTQEARYNRPQTPTSPTPYRNEDIVIPQTSSIMETPSRVRYKTFVPATTIDRWRKMAIRNTPFRQPATPSIGMNTIRNIRMTATDRPKRVFSANMKG